MRKILIIQHCQSEHHINNMSGGWTDTPLTKLGRNQANLIGLRLKREIKRENYVIYSSDLKRAWQTAEIIGKHLKLKIVKKNGLRELNTGVAAGKTKKWANANKNPANSNKDYIGDKRDKFDLDHRLWKNGETWREFFLRVSACMENIIDIEKKNLIIVTHGGTLNYIIAWWLKFEEDVLTKAHFSASPASISLLQDMDRNRHVLKVLNDTTHFKSNIVKEEREYLNLGEKLRIRKIKKNLIL